MRKALSTLLLVLALSISAFCQSFEGKITYAVSYKSKNAAITDAQLTTLMGNTQEYYIKGGNYKSILNGTFFQWQLYPSQDSVLYNKMAAAESIYWTDARVANEEILKTEINKGVTEILGYKCDELILTCKSGVQKFYFTSKFPVDYTLFNKHQYGNWFAFLQKAKAIPLRMSVDNAQLFTECTATEVKPMKLEKSFFQLASGSKLEKMPF